MMLKLSRLAAVFTTVLIMFGSAPAFAQNQPTGSGLSISPTVSEFTLKPGQASNVTITLKNITVDDIVAQAYINDFESDNATGNPKIITDPSVHSIHSIKNFVVGLGDIPLSKGQQKNITVGIQIPAKASPGAYYGIIRYKAVPAASAAPNQAGEVALTASVGTIVLITVPGAIHNQVQLSSLNVLSQSHRGTFFLKKPDTAQLVINNLGNGFVQPYGTIEMQNTFGKSVYTYQLNNSEQRANILPSSSRLFSNSLKNINQVGRYTLTASITYGNGSDVLVIKKTFWYVPVWLIAVVIVIIILLALLTLRAYWQIRRGGRRSHRRG